MNSTSHFLVTTHISVHFTILLLWPRLQSTKVALWSNHYVMIRTKYKLRYYNANEVSCCSTPVVQTCFKQHSNLDLLNEKKPHIIAYVGLVSTSVKWGNVKTVFLTFPRSWIDCNLLCSLHVRTHTHTPVVCFLQQHKFMSIE